MNRHTDDALSPRDHTARSTRDSLREQYLAERARCDCRTRFAKLARKHWARYPQGSAAGLALRALLAEIEGAARP